MRTRYYFVVAIMVEPLSSDYSSFLEIFRYSMLFEYRIIEAQGRQFFFMKIERPIAIAAKFWDECVIPKAKTHGFKMENMTTNVSLEYMIEKYLNKG